MQKILKRWEAEFFSYDIKSQVEAVDSSSQIWQHPSHEGWSWHHAWGCGSLFVLEKRNNKCWLSLEMSLHQSTEDLKLRWWFMFKHNNGYNHAAKSTVRWGTKPKPETCCEVICLKLLFIEPPCPSLLGSRIEIYLDWVSKISKCWTCAESSNNSPLCLWSQFWHHSLPWEETGLLLFTYSLSV